MSAAVAGSEIVATFVVPASILNRTESELLAAISERAASVGEPWLSLLEPREMIALMEQAGFVDVCCFGPEDASGKSVAHFESQNGYFKSGWDPRFTCTRR